MPDTPQPSTPAGPEVQAHLQEVAKLLRRSSTIDPDSRQALAELVDELSKTLAATPTPPAEVTHLAESTAHLVETLHHQEERLQATVRDRVEQAAVNAETHAPLAVGLVRRLLVALSNIGI